MTKNIKEGGALVRTIIRCLTRLRILSVSKATSRKDIIISGLKETPKNPKRNHKESKGTKQS